MIRVEREIQQNKSITNAITLYDVPSYQHQVSALAETVWKGLKAISPTAGNKRGKYGA